MESLSNNSRKKQILSQASKEEASRNHLLSLRRRPRFHTTAVDDTTDDNANNNNSILPRSLQISGVSHFQSQHSNGVALPTTHLVDPTRNIIHTSRSVSKAAYQPVFNSGLPLFYIPPNQAVFQPISRVLRSAETSKVIENEVDDDDVFVSSHNRTLPNHSSIPNHFSNRPNIPYNYLAFQSLESRKRAHSAGDIISLCPPSSVRYVYPNPNPVHISSPLNPISLPKSEPNFSFLNNSASNYIIPRKMCITDGSLQHTGLPGSASAVYNNKVANRSQFAKTNHQPETSPTASIQNSEKNLTLNKSHEEIVSKEVNRQRKVLARKQHMQQPEHGKVNSSGQTSCKQSTSKLSSKKKVSWSLPKKRRTDEEKPSVDAEVKLNVDIDLIKGNPDKFTAENAIGPYLIGPKLGSCPVKSISQYLIRKRDSSRYYMAKILHMTGNEEVKCGKMLLHTEHSLLSLLHSQPGVIRQHGIFKDFSFNKKTGTVAPRVCLVLDCLTPHEYNSESARYLNLQQYVIQMKRLSEHEASLIFYSIVSVVHSLHKANVVHRDLKLGNMVLDKRSRRVLLTNFGLGCHLTNDRDLLTDQRGSPAYISPDVLSDKPYAGKPSDIWSLGVILYTMLYGQFPFYDQEPKKLFAKIKAVDYTIPTTGQISTSTNEIIRALLTPDPHKRLTARDILVAMETEAASRSLTRSSAFQVVPDLDDPKTLELTNGKFQATPIVDEEQLTRDFRRKMVSDNKDDGSCSNLMKPVRRCTVPRNRNPISFISSSLPSSNIYRVQEQLSLMTRV